MRFASVMLIALLASLSQLPQPKDQARLEQEEGFVNKIVYRPYPRAVPPPLRLLAMNGAYDAKVQQH